MGEADYDASNEGFDADDKAELAHRRYLRYQRGHASEAPDSFDLKYPPKTSNPFTPSPRKAPMPTPVVKPLLRNCRIVGNSFRDADAKAAYASLTKGEVLTLVLEADNEHDPYAVMVLVEGLHIGYVPREMAAVLHATGVGEDVIAAVSEVGAKGSVMMSVGIVGE